MNTPYLIRQHQAFLGVYRRNLAFFLRQVVLYRNERATPVDIVFAIQFQREKIHILRVILRGLGDNVIDEPNDVESVTDTTRSQHATQLDQHTQDMLLYQYQQTIAKLLSDGDGHYPVLHTIRPDDPLRGIVHTHTLVLVRQLDGSHNQALIQFLRNTKLIDLGPTTGALVNLRNAALSHVDLTHAPLAQANLKGTNLRGSQLGGANLREADLHGADLYAANLCGTLLYRTNLSSAILCWSQLIRVNLREANLGEADLHGAYLYEADLRGADLRGANLREAKLTGALMPDGTTYDVATHFGRS